MTEKRNRKSKRQAARKVTKSNKPAPAVRDVRGTVHLVLHPGPGGHLQLGLKRALFTTDWQNEVALGTAATAHELLSASRTEESAVLLARKATSAASQIAEAALAATPESALACRAGCAHCCYQAVGVTAPEVISIFEHVRSTRTSNELDALASRIRAADEVTRGLPSSERFSPAYPCPFLENNRCSIYEVRPLACRGQNSLDAALCERTLHDTEARAERLSGKLSVPCYLEPIRASHAISAGLQVALHELYGLAMWPLELTAAMRVLFDDPSAVIQCWLEGGDPFRQARGGDSSDNPQSRALAGALLTSSASSDEK